MNALREPMSHTALGWVKPELDENLIQVGKEIEQFVEHPADIGPLRRCIHYLHQVQGSLRMLELPAPALLIEELERLIRALAQNAVRNREEACGLMLRCTMLLPNYLERLQGGHREVPVVLLPLLNEVRSARNAPPVAEKVLRALGSNGPEANLAEIEHARSSLGGRNRAVLDTVGNELKGELQRIKDALDLHMRLGQNAAQLQPQVEELDRIAATLAMMELTAARDVVLHQRKKLSDAISGVRVLDNTLLLDVANALLQVDAVLGDEAISNQADTLLENDSVAAAVQRTTEALAREALVNFVAAREGIVAFIETNWDHSHLAEIPRLLEEIVGALRILELSQPAAYLSGIEQYISTELIDHKRVPSNRQMDTLADAMSSFEYWLEALRDRRPGGEEILDITRSSLETLRYWPLPKRLTAAEKAAKAAAERAAAERAAAEKAAAERAAAERAAAERAAAERAAAERAAAERAAAERAAAERAAAERAAAERAAAEKAAAEKAAAERAAAERAAAERAAAERAAAERAAAERAAAERAAAERAAAERAAAERVAAERAAAERVAAERVAAERAAAERAAAERAAAERAAAERAAAERAAAERAAAERAAASPFPNPAARAFKAVADRFAATVQSLAPAAVASPRPVPVARVAATPAPAAGLDMDPMLAFMAGLDSMAEALFSPTPAAKPVAVAAPVVAAPPPPPITPQPVRYEAAQSYVSAELPAPPVIEHPPVVEVAPEPEPAPPVIEYAPVVEVAPEPEPVPAVIEYTPVVEVAPEPEPEPEPAPPVVVEPQGIEAGFESSEDVDQEIHEIFLEEFDEQVEELNNLLPTWSLAPDTTEQLHSVRRVFHTLKGSGRLVGARVLGEFAWKIEHLLNQVLDGSRPASPAVVAIINLAAETLPQFSVALRENGRVYADIYGIEEVAERISAGEEAFYTPQEAAAPCALDEPIAQTPPPPIPPTGLPTPVTVTTPTPEVPITDGTPFSVDSVLLSILHTEVIQHLGTIEQWLAEFRHWPRPVTPELLRALHTVHGAFAVSGVPEITAAISAAECLVKRSLAAAIMLTPDSVAALSETVNAINTTMAALQSHAPVIPCFAVLANHLRAQANALPEADWASIEEAVTEHSDPADTSLFTDTADADAAETLGFSATDSFSVDPEPFSAFAEEAVAFEYADPVIHTTGFTAFEEQPVVLDSAPEVTAIAPAQSQVFQVLPEDTPDNAQNEEIADHSNNELLDFTHLDRDLVDIFVEESKEQLDLCDELLEKWRDSPEDNHEILTALQRNLHTLKGGSRMAGIMAMGDLSHSIESLIEGVVAGQIEVDESDFNLLERAFDRLHQSVLRTGNHYVVHRADELINALENRLSGDQHTAVDAEAAPATENSAPAATDADTTDTAAQDTIGLPAEPPPPLSQAPSDEDDANAHVNKHVRVRADLLDQLVNQAGEVAIYRSRLEQQLTTFGTTLLEMDRTNARLRDQLRRLELETEAQIVARYRREQEQSDRSFDPLELDRFSTVQQLSRALHESAADLSGLQGTLEELARHYELLLQQQSRAASDLQEGLMRSRLVPFDTIASRLRRLLRQVANNTGKQVQLNLQGTSSEIDRHVLERMVAPLEHMLRNCVAHGIETPTQRRAAGKAPKGTITVRMHHEGSEIVLIVADDGAGLDQQRIRQRAEQRGLIEPGQVVDPHQLNNLILESGLSTSAKVDQLSGRGVGLDVVRSEVRQLGGSVDIQSETGKGVRFILRLPQAMAVTQAVFVRIGEAKFAVPMASVIGVGRIALDRFESDDHRYYYNSEDYPLYDLGTLLGIPSVRAESGQPHIPLLLVRVGELRAAVAVNQVLGNREVVVKQVGQQILSIPGIHGATITGDGTVMIILDVVPLVRRYQTRPQTMALAEVPKPQAIPLVMVVDDSLTMRKVTSRVLERHNFEVAVARDGVEALEKMEEQVPDLMLLDIEMPRMDGYELAKIMRADSRYQNIPIIMITSRSGDKHRQRALDLGVQRHLGKPYQELDLMRNVYDLLGGARGQ